ncbi:MAG: hypothetical protein OEW52_06950 [Thermoleophilia bacterium]|nr:hypothetical protein [Thermoleophilia bacterium]MDH5280875.1 hypothetical protein [Thermoleophilia bacterium]
MANETLAGGMTEVGTGLPTGVVTFLFGDIEGSTQMLENHRAAAGAALALHHELLQTAVEDASGVVFETVGDAVYGAFTRPTDAITAAVAIQRALEAEDWGEIGELRARIAVHTGAVETRGEHYFGAALFERARRQRPRRRRRATRARHVPPEGPARADGGPPGRRPRAVLLSSSGDFEPRGRVPEGFRERAKPSGSDAISPLL